MVSRSNEIGIGLGEWNLDNYKIKKNNNLLYVNNEILIVFHFNL